MDDRRSTLRNEAILIAIAVGLGAIGAAGYAAWRYVRLEDATTGERWSAFGEAMLFPGAAIIVAVAAIVWLGWKANID
ncbi:MAG: hypothetical protein WD359_10080 [Dehalococcoidia bacterium]